MAYEILMWTYPQNFSSKLQKTKLTNARGMFLVCLAEPSLKDSYVSS